MGGASELRRVEQMYKGITAIMPYARKLKTAYCYPYEDAAGEIVRLCESMWHTFLSSSYIRLAVTPWEGFSYSTRDYSPFPIALRIYLQDKRDGGFKYDELGYEKDTDVFEFDEYMGVEHILYHVTYPVDNWALDSVYAIYTKVVDMAGWLRSYDPELREAVPDFDKTLSLIAGSCYEIFSQEESFALAHAAYHAFSRIFVNYGPADIQDFFTKWLVNGHNYHSLLEQVKKTSLEHYVKWHMTLELDSSLFNRLMAFIDLGGVIPPYERKAFFEKAKEMLKPADIAKVKKALEDKVVSRKKDQEERDEYDPFNLENLENRLGVYGLSPDHIKGRLELANRRLDKWKEPEEVPVKLSKKKKK